MTNNSAAKSRRVSSTSRGRSKKSPPANLNNTAALNGVETNTDQTGQIIAMPATTELTKNMNLDASEMTLNPLPGNRPIDSSNIHVVSTISVMGERPIVASNNKIWNTITASGERPIYSSNLVISSTVMIMGNRPVASNFFEGEGNLMGYLD